MSEQKDMRFTKVSGGKMYLSEEVDGYIEILRNAYSEVLTELKGVKEQSAKNQENFAKEQEKAKQMLESERAEQQGKLTKLNESLQQEQKAKEANLVSLSELEKAKGSATENLEKVNKMLADERSSKQSIQQELAKIKEQKDALQQQLVEAKADNDNLQKEKATLVESNNNKSFGNASDYISLLKRTADTADSYVRDIEEKMNQLEMQAQTKCETQISQAHQESANILEDANTKALSMIKKAENKRQEILTRTKTEYEGIRGLIERSSKEYGDMATNAKEEQLEWDS